MLIVATRSAPGQWRQFENCLRRLSNVVVGRPDGDHVDCSIALLISCLPGVDSLYECHASSRSRDPMSMRWVVLLLPFAWADEFDSSELNRLVEQGLSGVCCQSTVGWCY